jgi:hypothetical protein
MPYHGNVKWHALALLLSFQPFSEVYTAWYAAYVQCLTFVLISEMTFNIKITGLFYSLWLEPSLWFCCKQSTHITEAVWWIHSTAVVSFLLINCLNTIFSKKNKGRVTTASNSYRLFFKHRYEKWSLVFFSNVTWCKIFESRFEISMSELIQKFSLMLP